MFTPYLVVRRGLFTQNYQKSGRTHEGWRTVKSKEHSVILTAQRDSFYNRGKLNYHPIGKDSRWAVQRLSRYPRCVQAPSGRGCAMNSTLALTSGLIGWSSSCPIPKRA